MLRQRRAPQLPHALTEELGLAPSQSRQKNAVKQRKEQRRANRVEKRQWRRPVERQQAVVRGRVPVERRQAGVRGRPPVEDDEEDKESDEEEEAGLNTDTEAEDSADDSYTNGASTRSDAPRVHAQNRIPDPSEASSDSVVDDSDEEEDEDYERLYRGDSPEIVLDAGSRTFKDRQAEDDADIAALEKRLGMRSDKRGGPDQDGLSEILGDIDAEGGDETLKRKREENDWLRSKRQKAVASARKLVRQRVEDSDNSDGDIQISEESEEVNDSFDGFDSDEEAAPVKPPAKRERENPYVAPTVPNGKYVPPSLRKAQSQPDEALFRLRRQLQGHLNKLSEANLISIVSEVESIYRANPRGDVTNTLIDLLLSLFTSPASLSNTFVILHAAFATAIYRVIGVDFGAELLSSLVDRFFGHHQNSTTAQTTPKEPLNLLSLLAHMFIFSFVASPIVISMISRLLDPLTEANAELLLRLIRDCGPQLRSTDPGALKSIVARSSAAVNKLQAEGQAITVRTKFMLETLTDLKNNKMRESTANAGASREHIIRMRKALGSLSSRNLRATEPLRVDLSDILDSDRKGKWWLVGASWKGHDAEATSGQREAANGVGSSPAPNGPLNAVPAASEVFSISGLASTLRLSTPLQQGILSAIAFAPNPVMAHEHLLKLNLKQSQIQEIPLVVLRCCAAEPGWNAFYGHLASRLCMLGNKAGRIRKAWEFTVWNYLRSIGANADNDEDDGGDGFEDDDEESKLTDLNAVNNTARLLATLIHEGHVNLGVLRTVDVHLLKDDSKGQLWVEMLLVTVLVKCQGDETSVRRVFERLDNTRQLAPGLRVFMKKYVRKSPLSEGKDERDYVKRGYKIAERVLETLGR